MIGSFMVAESPRWLLLGGKKEAAYTRCFDHGRRQQADLELKEMEEVSAAEKAKSRWQGK